MNKLLCVLLLLPLSVMAELKSLDETDLENVSGQGIEIDLQADFADSANFDQANWIAYRRTLYDTSGNAIPLIDANGDGNVDGQTIFNTATLNNDPLRMPYYVILGKITGSIKLEGLQFNLSDTVDYTVQKGSTREIESQSKPALKWTLPEFISFKKFKIDGLYVSEDATVDASDNRVIGLEANGNLYLPAQPKAFVFITDN